MNKSSHNPLDDGVIPVLRDPQELKEALFLFQHVLEQTRRNPDPSIERYLPPQSFIDSITNLLEMHGICVKGMDTNEKTIGRIFQSKAKQEENSQIENIGIPPMSPSDQRDDNDSHTTLECKKPKARKLDFDFLNDKQVDECKVKVEKKLSPPINPPLTPPPAVHDTPKVMKRNEEGGRVWNMSTPRSRRKRRKKYGGSMNKKFKHLGSLLSETPKNVEGIPSSIQIDDEKQIALSPFGISATQDQNSNDDFAFHSQSSLPNGF